MSAGVSGGFLLRRLLGSAISNATGYALGTAVSPTLVPFVQSLENEAWTAHTVKPLQAAAAAEAAARGFRSTEWADDEGQQVGTSLDRMSVLRQLAGQAPAIETLIALRRRGAISESKLDTGIEQLGYLPEWRANVKALRNVLPSVTDMVRFAVREVYDPGQRSALDLDADYPAAFGDDAALIGLSDERARQYWAAHWDLPSADQMAQMLFRGELSQDQFNRGLRALDYAPTWRPKLQAILQPIPPLSDMIRFAVREVYSPESVSALGLDQDFPTDFATQAALHGLDTEYARQYWRAHWRLPSAQQGYRMLWRGEITQAQLAALLKALDYTPIWRDKLQAIAYLVPGRIDLKRMFKFGILTREQVKAGYQRLGYEPQDAEYLTQIAEHEATTATTSTPWLNRARSRLYTVAHNEYLDDSLDQAGAQTMLTQVGVPAGQHAQIIALWEAERGISRLELTPAQIRKAFKKGLYTEDVALAELRERGMTDEDARTFLQSG